MPKKLDQKQKEVEARKAERIHLIAKVGYLTYLENRLIELNQRPGKSEKEKIRIQNEINKTKTHYENLDLKDPITKESLELAIKSKKKEPKKPSKTA